MSRRKAGVLSSPAIKWNGRKILIVGNSFKFSPGGGETKVNRASGGGGTGVMVVGHDVTTEVTKIEFELYNTAENQQLVEDMKALTRDYEAATLEAVEKAEQYQFEECYMVNDPEFPFESEGKIKVEFHGAPLN